DTGLGYDESAKPNPISKYGETKAEGEKLLQKNTDKFYLIRLSRLFGPPSSDFGVSKPPSSQAGTSKKSFVDLVVDLAAQKKELRLVDEEASCPTYSADLAGFTLNLIRQKIPFGIYHGANSGTSTWYSLAKEVFKIKKISAKVTPIKSSEYIRPAKRPLYSELLNTKLSAQRSWHEALTEYLRIPPPSPSP
ncbi:MAG: sugar nucleotide-binding protein, partial [Patescibacteria group bacterium]